MSVNKQENFLVSKWE
uniref:Uncharacterized protein n=1 Tax=Rhizophora mucronata TaxID=61149 RepID=A0A2P2J092_RHIMU